MVSRPPSLGMELALGISGGSGMKLRIAEILLLAGLGAPVAEAAARAFGGEVSLGYGFKPEFIEAEGDGKYVLVGGKASMKTEAGWSISVEESLKAVEHPEKKAALEDPIIRIGRPTEALGLTLRPGLTVVPGLSLDSRAARVYGAVRPGLSVAKKVGSAELGVGVSTTRIFQRYTLAADGSSNLSHSVAGSLFGSVAGGPLSVSFSLAYRELVPYEGAKRYGYLNQLSLEHQTTEALSFECTLSTSDAQQAADGADVNEFSVYRQNKTEVYLGATYAL